MEKYITTPLTEDKVKDIQAGDFIYITGTIYSARDAAHKRMYDALLNNQPIPITLKDNIIYYLGPTPARKDQIIGSAGPTTSSRMDKYTPLLIEHGLKGMIGKGKRSNEVKKSIQENDCIYFAAIGGAGALLSKAIKSSRVIAYDDLGTEAIRELVVKDFPVIAIIDSSGTDIYKNIK